MALGIIIAAGSKQRQGKVVVCFPGRRIDANGSFKEIDSAEKLLAFGKPDTESDVGSSGGIGLDGRSKGGGTVTGGQQQHNSDYTSF